MYTLRHAVRSIPGIVPGFEFHPTDQQLISYYLKRKCQGACLEPDMIPVIDIYQHNPWTLPGKCPVTTSYHTWHFFVPEVHSDRATETGHWELSNEQKIKKHNRVVGKKKTHIFFSSQGVQTEWNVDEYHLQENEYERARKNNLDCFILCRVSTSEQPDEQVHQNEEFLPEEVQHQNQEVLPEDLEQSETDVNNDNAISCNSQPQEDFSNSVDGLTDRNFEPEEKGQQNEDVLPEEVLPEEGHQNEEEDLSNLVDELNEEEDLRNWVHEITDPNIDPNSVL